MKKGSIFILLLLVAGVLCLGIYFVNNYDSFEAYLFDGESDSFLIKGSAMFTKEKNVLNIIDIGYKKVDVNVAYMAMTLYTKIDDEERIIFSSGSGDPNALDYINKDIETDHSSPIVSNKIKTFSLIEHLYEMNYNIIENNGYDEYFPKEVKDNFQNNTYLEFEAITEDGENINEKIKLEMEKYSNNKWFYKKADHI